MDQKQCALAVKLENGAMRIEGATVVFVRHSCVYLVRLRTVFLVQTPTTYTAEAKFVLMLMLVKMHL